MRLGTEAKVKLRCREQRSSKSAEVQDCNHIVTPDANSERFVNGDNETRSWSGVKMWHDECGDMLEDGVPDPGANALAQ